MTEATAILSPNRETQRMLRHRSAVMTLARMHAKKSVLHALRAQGLKPQHFSVREIGVLTDYYLNQHRMSLPKIRSVWIRSMSQNHRIIRADVCDPARAVDLRCRHFQVATQAASREAVSSSSA
jgi:hypothetical protein